MKSENWGGLASMTGSLISLAAGDAQSVVSTASFLAAEVSFAKRGDTSWGYSLGCAGIAIGDGMLCYSRATVGNPALKVTMAVVTTLYGAGAFRYPLGWTAYSLRHNKNPIAKHLVTIGRASIRSKPVIGSLALMTRVPALYTAAFEGDHVNKVMFLSNAFWGMGDTLAGRVQQFVEGPIKSFVDVADIMTGGRAGKYVIAPILNAGERVYRNIAGNKAVFTPPSP